MDQKKLKKKSKKELEQEVLPIFLTELTYVPPEAPRPRKQGRLYSKPIFFGPINNVHPPLHSLDFRGPPHVPKSFIAKQYIDDLFYPKTESERKIQSLKAKKYRHVKKPKHYSDPFAHICPGRRKVFAPEVKLPVIDLGKTTSVIEGEASLEIPLYRLKRDCSGESDTKLELVKYSDLKEKQRPSLPYKQRIAHIHFPKQFATVSVIGPTIPASLIITKIPSKRCKTSVANLLSKAQSRKGTKSEDGLDTSSEKPEESGGNNSQNDNTITTAEAGFTSENKLEEYKEEIEEEEEEDEEEEELEEGNQELKEQMANMNEEDTMKEDTEVEKTEDEEIDENTEQNEGQEEENTEE